ncbi:MAG: 3-deoxy-manno-octulosonate cytidylyltransferase [Verrucomicrobium sp.]|nr:3-deoxy-manno-octulosonate cytidylyltransferase [Verrucomicrobium sp.]
MKTVIVIPARYASTRFPGKPLVLIKGKPLIQWVWEKARKCKRADRVVVATDDERIFRAVEWFGGEAVMTSPEHPTGTDRIAEAARRLRAKADLYVNIQGDEPAVDPKEIERLIAGIGRSPIATLAHAVTDPADLANPNVVKVVCDAAGRALYFSRSPIPFARGKAKPRYLRHVGLYAFRAEALRRFVKLPPGVLEQAESLEQLRALENGMAIRVVETKMRCHGVDTPADLRLVQKLL